MRQAILISIQPKWCEKIASGNKTIEIRKTKPKLDTPFKCYIYCTSQKTNGDLILCKSEENVKLFGHNKVIGINKGFMRTGDIPLKGMVIGEFVCDKIFQIRVFEDGGIQDYLFHKLEKSCVPYDEIVKYIGLDNTGYGWSISNLTIYDKPRKMSEFTRLCDDSLVSLKRPPQSWGYIEEVIEDAP